MGRAVGGVVFDLNERILERIDEDDPPTSFLCSVWRWFSINCPNVSSTKKPRFSTGACSLCCRVWTFEAAAGGEIHENR